mmetsp:Transcript_10771/g.16247  ORF Transcript_10771/g.16247 Transcript_10771/m.16247 type:complete len:214 (+) Transcript_10771:68-709(+)
MDQVLTFHTILRQWFVKPLNMVQCNHVFKSWVLMRDWPDRAERLARILGSQATTCELLLSQMDANLDFDVAAAQLHEARGVDLNSIDLELVRAQRLGTNSQNKEPLVDWIIFTDRKSCAVPKCEGQLTLDRPARVNGEGIAKKMKQTYNTKRSDSNVTFLLSDQASLSTVGGPDELSVYMLSKWCSVCGAQHNCDRAIVKTWSTNGRAKTLFL